MKRFAVADPPYPGQSAKHYSGHQDYAGEVDHRELAEQLGEYDGWILHTSAPALLYVQQCLAATGEMPMDPETFKGGTYRVYSWVKPFAAFKRNVKVAYTWEPVLIKPLRGAETNRIEEIVYRDHLICEERPEEAVVESITMKRGLTGAKPEKVCHWAFEAAGLHPDDDFYDLFPGSGAVTRAWESWRAHLGLLEAA